MISRLRSPRGSDTRSELTGVMVTARVVNSACGVWGGSPSGVRGGAPRRNFGLEWRVLNENRTGLAGRCEKKLPKTTLATPRDAKHHNVLSLLTVLLGLCRCFVAARLLRVAVR